MNAFVKTTIAHFTHLQAPLPAKSERVTRVFSTPRHHNKVTVIASASSSSHGNTEKQSNRNDVTSSPFADGRAASWQEELRMLFDPQMPAGAKQVLAQDLAKRAPELFNHSCLNQSLRDFGLSGVADVFRQFQEDLLPDLIANGPKYVSKAAEELPKTFSRANANAENTRPGIPSSVKPEEVGREFRNIFNRTPEGLFTPEYKILGKFDGYEIRQYPTLIVAETPMMPSRTNTSTGPTEVENASTMGQSFNNLAGFLFGKNKDSKAMKMTTPVILSKGVPEETMSFIIGEYGRVEDVPKSLDEKVTLREQPGQIFAVLEFTGFATQGEAKRQRRKLLSLLSRDDIALAPDTENSFKCMIYNGPSTLPNLRRNDLMIEVVYSAEAAKSF